MGLPELWGSPRSRRKCSEIRVSRGSARTVGRRTGGCCLGRPGKRKPEWNQGSHGPANQEPGRASAEEKSPAFRHGNLLTASEASPIQAARPPTEHLQGIVERVTYHAEDSGYTVARLKVPSHSDLVTIVGRFPSISAGQTLRVSGVFREHAKFGQQFQVVHAQEMKPATF